MAAVLTATVMYTPAAAAPVENGRPPGKSLVVLGDSFTANYPKLFSGTKECLHAPTSWPSQLSRRMGLAGTPDFVDASCSGSTISSGQGWWLVHEVAEAVKQQAFGPETDVIAIQTGMNDVWSKTNLSSLITSLQPCVFNFVDGCGLEAADQGRFPDYRNVTGQLYAKRIREVITYLRFHAPNARIMLVGYPELFPAGQEHVCVNVLGAGHVVQPRGRAVTEYLDRLDDAQREAAELLKLEFVDIRSVTAGHGLCSDEPWLNGFFDPAADEAGMPFHPSAHGDAVTAEAVYERIHR
ncbi:MULTISPECIES: SGNH/GDSL hydrolase family protein [Nocardia]|uniref:SGNH/GDSL hydrolase family protein n=1 Tax=Nocardia TaxID=1817 RepID=UPI001894446C|nr:MULTISPECIES: SGNH/GDSL hydrolase family protein [Nocardia]MBF6351299.1 SGNH/GDSL hydrolase family protein [Nocardia flavorosea]